MSSPVKNYAAMTKEQAIKVKSAVKTFNTMQGVGKAKYVVNHHNGIDTNKDGSPFYDCSIFKNKRSFTDYCTKLKEQGYIEQ